LGVRREEKRHAVFEQVQKSCGHGKGLAELNSAPASWTAVALCRFSTDDTCDSKAAEGYRSPKPRGNFRHAFRIGHGF